MKILVTGANRGIGQALCTLYAQRGDTVTGTARGGKGGLLELDVADPASVAALPGKLDGGPLDLLVCNAGVYLEKGRQTDAYAPDLWVRTFAVNVTGVFLTVQALLPALVAGRGKIAILSSVMASDARAPGGSYIYRASKAAALNLGRNLAADLKPKGVAVGIYHPGWVRSDMGGAGADIDVAEAAAGLAARFDALSLQSTGCFEDWQGSAIPF